MVKRMSVWMILCSLLLSGCWDRIEVNDVAIVTAAAIDKAENKQIELSIQVFVPRALGGGGGLRIYNPLSSFLKNDAQSGEHE